MEDQMTEKQRAFCETIKTECKATKYGTISGDITHLCPECVSAFGYEDEEDDDGNVTKTAAQRFEEDYENGDLCDEGGFSWHSCDLCQSPLGGNRYAAHGWIVGAVEDTLVHYDICEDCLCYLANGDVPADEYL